MSTINVTRSFLPPLTEVVKLLEEVWANGQLTNNGPLVQRLERAVAQWLGVPHLLALNNGTIAIQLALRAVGATGTVLTTPYSYVATTSSILWEHCRPVFIDVDPATLCIDPAQLEAGMRDDTTAILATHVYGIPCDVEAIERFAKKHQLAVIYDAAHAFGTLYDGRSVLSWGDLSTLSFHATKLFHSAEGGAVVSTNSELVPKLQLLRSFGHVGDGHYSLGINGKMSELSGAVGLAVLPHMPTIQAGRRRVVARYLRNLRGAPVRYPQADPRATLNDAYFPVLFASEAAQERVRAALRDASINARRYFYPSLNTLPYVEGAAACPVSEEAARTVLCLPLYPDLADDDVDRISELVRSASERP